jgi:hypothetical protein
MDKIIRWLLSGDPSIQYMTLRFLCNKNSDELIHLQESICKEGFGAEFLSRQNADGHWGRYYYQPKWTSTHYTLLDLKNLHVPPHTAACTQMVEKMFNECMKEDGSVNLAKNDLPSDVCVDGMILNYASYFCSDKNKVTKLVDYILAQQKPDGGFTWQSGTGIGDPHTTICVLEGLREYQKTEFQHKTDTLKQTKAAEQFLVNNNLFMHSKDRRFLKLSYPYRYHYSLLRALDYFSDTACNFNMRPAVDWLKEKQRKDGLWKLEYKYPGAVHFEMEKVGEPSRFITLKAIKILTALNHTTKAKA